MIQPKLMLIDYLLILNNPKMAKCIWLRIMQAYWDKPKPSEQTNYTNINIIILSQV